MGINRKYITLLISLLAYCSSYAGNVTVRGEAPAYIGKKISAFTFDNHFIKSLSLVDITTVDSNGYFQLTFDSEVVQMINLRCDFVNAHLYIQPNIEYNVLLPPLPLGQSKSINNTAKVDVFFNDLDENDINNKIIRFNDLYNGFYEKNYNLLMRITRPRLAAINDSSQSVKKSGSSTKLYAKNLAEFSSELDSIFGRENDYFFLTYRISVEADMKLNAGTSPRDIYENYIRDFSIDLKNPEQTNLLASFYENYIDQFDEKFGLDTLIDLINNKNPVRDCLSEIGKDDFLQDMVLREIIFANALFDMNTNKELDKERIVEILNELAANGSGKVSRDLSKNLSLKIQRNTVGKSAYNFNVKDANGKPHLLEDYKGKYVLLEFWASWCKECNREMILTNKLYEKYKDDFSFVSISVEEDETKMKNFVDQNSSLKQIFLHKGDDVQIMEMFDINSLPAYVIIDAESNIYRLGAPFPSNVLEAELHKISIERKKNTQDNFDLKR